MRIYFLLVGLIVLSCKKPEDRNCLKFNGDEIEKMIEVEDFTGLHLGPYLDFVLVQDTVNFIYLLGGENVLNKIEFNVNLNDNALEIKNLNKCRFLRNKKNKITAEIHFQQLSDIFFEGSGTLTNSGQLNIPNLEITLNEASGSANLNLKSNNISISAEPSWANYTLNGTTTNLDMTVKGNSFADTRNMIVSNSLTVKSRSSADVYVNASGTAYFKCESWSNGNIYYIGTPGWKGWNNYGTGQLLISE